MIWVARSVCLANGTEPERPSDDPAVSEEAANSEPRAGTKGLLPIPNYQGDLLHRGRLTGDWNGARINLANRGVQIDADYTQYFQSIASGGLDEASRYGGHLDYLVHLDLMRMDVLDGALLTLRAETRYGKSVNAESGQLLPVNTEAYFPLTQPIDQTVPISVTELNYTQFFSEKFALTIGKLQTLDGDPNEFASGRGKSQFMDASFIFNPVTTLRMPYSTLGAGFLVIASEHVSVKGSLFNTLDSSTTSGFENLGDGLTAGLEADIQYRLGDLPGGMNFGGLYSFDQNFNQIGGELILQPGQSLAISQENSTWAFYWSAWQYLVTLDSGEAPVNVSDGSPDHRGFGLFARAGVADQQTNPVQFSGSLGLGGRGIFPGRPDDTFGFGYAFSAFQNSRITGPLNLRTNSHGFELFYNLELTPAARFTVDAQVGSAALSGVGTTFILGARLNLAL